MRGHGVEFGASRPRAWVRSGLGVVTRRSVSATHLRRSKVFVMALKWLFEIGKPAMRTAIVVRDSAALQAWAVTSRQAQGECEVARFSYG